jgi:hypothetical protein
MSSSKQAGTWVNESLGDLGRIEAEIIAAWAAVKIQSWSVANWLLKVKREKLYEEGGYHSWKAWVEGRLPLSRSTAHRMVAAAEVAAEVEDEGTRKELFEFEPTRLFPLRSLIANGRADEAIELAKSDSTVDQIYDKVSDLQRDQHRPQMSRLTLLIPMTAREHFERALSIARFTMGARNPSMGECLEVILVEYTQNPLPRKFEPYRKEIEEGQVHCALWGTDFANEDCRGHDASVLDRHHIFAGRHRKDSPWIWLCRPCHEYWQPQWRDLAAKLGYEVPA